MRKRMRVRFERKDENYLYVTPTADGAAEKPLRVRYNVPQVNEEFAETCCLLWRDAKVNLLDVTTDEEGILTPHFIILEPDYLIDISSLAECFKEYGHHPANYLLSRLQPSENTRPLLLGNIANLFLDEWIHAEEAPDYLACMKKAFRTYPIELAACADLHDKEKEKQFFADCKMHFDHIRQTVTETFHDSGYKLDKTDAVLEPSYICEPLGLQGRLDYMQRDMTSFIEMKSGKADEYSVRGKVVPRENNRVQMLLYEAVLEYSMGMEHSRVKPYLLYTRYPLLYPARTSWAQVRRVMNVRNRIVATEYAIQLRNHPPYTAERLKEIEPDTLNERRLRTRLWREFLYPQINAVSQSIRSLSPLERSYFYTLYNFVTKELYTSKAGEVTREGSTVSAALWFAPLAEKCEAGEILYDLRLALEADNLIVNSLDADNADDADTKIKSALSVSSASKESISNFRKGDAVVLYERNTENDSVTNKMVFKGTIEQITGHEVRIRLRMAQRNKHVLPPDSRYAIEHDHMDTAFRTMYAGLALFLSATQRRRDLLLCQRPPEFDTSWDERIATAPDDFCRIILKAQAARDYFLLVGPPGTGKTSRALRGMVEAFYGAGRQVLLLAYTHRAVDEICKALTAIRPEMDFIRLGSELSCEEAYRSHLVEKVLEPCNSRKEVQERIDRCRVFVGTVATLCTKTELFRLKRFDVAIIDEATQILEPQLLGLLCMRTPDGSDAIGKFVMIGDHKQLPAVVQQPSEQSEVRDEALRNIGLHNLKDSLFERLIKAPLNPPKRGTSEADKLTANSLDADNADDADKKIKSALSVSSASKKSELRGAERISDILCRQGRMNVEVAHFPNQAFYGGRLEPVGLPHQQGALTLAPELQGDEFAPLLTRRVAFLPSVADPSAQFVKQNHSEARIVARLAAALYRQYAAEFNPSATLGIITPYRSQIALIKKEIAAQGIAPLNEIVTDTVERFQGSERDVIIYSFCVNHPHQLKLLANLTEDNGVQIDRKLNVALTRARKQMFLTGVPELLNLNPIYAALLSSLSEQ